MNEPAVSIVIPAYNASPFVGETLASVLAMEYSAASLELIVVDDGSTDDTVDEVRRCLHSAPFRWQVLEVANGGPSRARNVGWQAAQGEWIQFLDADDLLDPAKLRIQTEVAAIAGPEAAVIYSPWQRIAIYDKEWRPTGDICVPHIGDDLFDLLQTRNFLQLGSQLMRRDWLAKVDGFNEAYRLIEDVDLLLRIAMAGGRFFFAPADRPLLFYRQREGSLSQASRRGFIEGCVRNARLAESFWREKGNALSVPQRALLIAIYGEALRFFAEADRGEFRSLLTHVLELDSGYLPGGTALRFLTRLLGHEPAQSLAVRFRKLRYGAEIGG